MSAAIGPIAQLEPELKLTTPAPATPVTLLFGRILVIVQLEPVSQPGEEPSPIEDALLIRETVELISSQLAPATREAPIQKAVSTLEEVAEDSFRKTIVAMGQVGAGSINGVARVRDKSAAELKIVSDRQIKLIVESYLHMVAGSANVGVAYEKWYAEFLPENVFVKRLLRELAEQIVKPLKMSRWGAGLRLLCVLLLQYQDMVSDILVMMDFYRNKQFEAFRSSLSFFCLALLMHVVVSLMKNFRRPMKAKAWGVLQAVFMVQPAIESYNHWSGKAMEDDDVMSPVQILIAGRAIEIVFESLPEVVIQSSIAIQQPEKASTLLYFSICSSVTAAAAIMTDTNVSYELATMNKQERGQHSHPFYGLIPKGTWGIHMLYLGGFLFLVGYLGTGVAAITTVMLGHSARWIALYLAAEFAGVFLILVKTGRQYFAIASGQAASVVQWVVMYLMMQFVPWAQLRNPINFGGAWFSRWVTWRLIANTVVFALVVKDLVMWMYYGALLGAAVVGIGLIMYNVSDTHRWTLCESRESGKEHMMQYFDSQIEPASLETTVDGHRVEWIVFLHPSYFEGKVVLDWLLTLELDNQVFVEGAVFGKSAGGEAGKTHEAWFDKVLERIPFYSKGEGELVAKATAHLGELRVELKQREENRATS